MIRLPDVKSRLVRYLLVGVVNTGVNFAALNFVFFILKQSRVVSSILATCVVAGISFYLNRKFVFQHKGASWKTPVLFFVVMFSGTLGLQNAVFALFSWLLSNNTAPIIGFAGFIGIQHLGVNVADINTSNVIASLSSRLWNYNGYRLFVFNKGEDKKDLI